VSFTYSLFIVTPAWVPSPFYQFQRLSSWDFCNDISFKIADAVLAAFVGFGGFIFPITVFVYMLLLAPLIFFSLRYASLDEKKVRVPIFGHFASRLAGE